MNVSFSIQPQEKLALRNPEQSELGIKIVRQGLILMHEMGYEHFTFKKLAAAIGTTEASIYRYFENKHRLLLYLLTWYWNYLEYSVVVALQNLDDPSTRIKKVIDILSGNLPDWSQDTIPDIHTLHLLAISESSKTYLIKEVDDINREQLFKPYKDLCRRIALLFQDYAPLYPYSHSLASTLLETSHTQLFFAEHLPSLTDLGPNGTVGMTRFLEHLVFAVLDHPVPER